MEKGKTNNPNGRPKGSKNKVEKPLRLWVQNFIEGKTKDLEKAWNDLEPKDKFIMFEKLLAYSLPKPQTIDLNMNLESLKEEDIDRIFDRLIHHSDETK